MSALARPNRTVWLRDVATGLAKAVDLWTPHLRHDPERRQFTRLLVAETYDAWLIGWWPGQGVALHDHGGSAGALCVVEGRLVESHADGDGRLAYRSLGVGEFARFGSDHVHAVANLDDTPATSIHVYTPALTSMAFFGATDEGLHLTRIESVSDAVGV